MRQDRALKVDDGRSGAHARQWIERELETGLGRDDDASACIRRSIGGCRPTGRGRRASASRESDADHREQDGARNGRTLPVVSVSRSRRGRSIAKRGSLRRAGGGDRRVRWVTVTANEAEPRRRGVALGGRMCTG